MSTGTISSFGPETAIDISEIKGFIIYSLNPTNLHVLP
jgi:hypothetical protein